MGMYTEFHFNKQLKADVPKEVKDTLLYMLGEIEKQPKKIKHPLFETDRWETMLLSDSFYFDAPTSSCICTELGIKYLSIRCNLKNYDNEIEKFIDWITPYLDGDEGDFLGFSRYEESETPDLIYLNK